MTGSRADAFHTGKTTKGCTRKWKFHFLLSVFYNSFPNECPKQR